MSTAPRTDLKHLREGILRGDRVVLGRAITLVESQRAVDRAKAENLIQSLLPLTGRSIRIGITGAPGAGKSTYIEALGNYLTSTGKRLAVLAIDPSSQKTKGSILGDKTRMDTLARNPLAFIRPTPAGTSVGGVAFSTQESILLCEAAGYEVIVVETVGVGQSEIAVRGMVDFFLLLMLAGAGDELQGIKKGIMEMADGILITKSDGDNVTRARQAQASYRQALHLFQPPASGWLPHVLTVSSLAKTGIAESWQMVESFRGSTVSSGHWMSQRKSQQVEWFRTALQNQITSKALHGASKVIHAAERSVGELQTVPTKAARDVFKSLGKTFRQ